MEWIDGECGQHRLRTGLVWYCSRVCEDAERHIPTRPWNTPQECDHEGAPTGFCSHCCPCDKCGQLRMAEGYAP